MHSKVTPKELLSATEGTDDDAIIVEIARLFGWVALFAFAFGAGVIVLLVSMVGT